MLRWMCCSQGYSGAPGQPTEQSATQNADCVYRYLIQQQGFDPEDIILFGRSLGSAVLTQCAARNKVGALILLSPFTSVRSVVQYGHGHSTLGGVAASFITDCFKTVESIQQVDAPLLIVHGMLDELVPVAQAEAVLRAAGSTIKELHVAPGMSHQNVFHDEQRTELFAVIHRFLCREQVLQPILSSSPRTAIYPTDE